jgi:hypothetical protein
MKPSQFELGIKFLLNVKNDFQFDKTSPDYLGFLNCGRDITDDRGFMVIVEHQEEFEPIMESLGISTESGIHEDETIFILID